MQKFFREIDTDADQLNKENARLILSIRLVKGYDSINLFKPFRRDRLDKSAWAPTPGCGGSWPMTYDASLGSNRILPMLRNGNKHTDHGKNHSLHTFPQHQFSNHA